MKIISHKSKVKLLFLAENVKEEMFLCCKGWLFPFSPCHNVRRWWLKWNLSLHSLSVYLLQLWTGWPSITLIPHPPFTPTAVKEEGANVAKLPGYFFYRVSNYDSLSVVALYNKWGQVYKFISTWPSYLRDDNLISIYDFFFKKNLPHSSLKRTFVT